MADPIYLLKIYVVNSSLDNDFLEQWWTTLVQRISPSTENLKDNLWGECNIILSGYTKYRHLG